MDPQEYAEILDDLVKEHGLQKGLLLYYKYFIEPSWLKPVSWTDVVYFLLLLSSCVITIQIITPLFI